MPNVPPIVETDYVYDKASNRLAVLDGRPRARQANRDHVATMDGLHRLTQYDRGVAVENSGVWSINTFAQGSQAWGYDHLGNWMTSQEDLTGDGDFLDTDENEPRTHNLANELLGRDIDNDTTDEITITYDHAGNILLTDDGTTEYGYTHDAWNRLVKITIDGGSGATTLGEYEYNGMNHRIRTRVDTDFSGSVDEERIMIYDASWRLAEEQIDTNLDETADEVRAHIWGLRYIDDALAMLKDTDVDGDYEDGGGSERYFYVTDAQFSVVAVLDDAANIEERISYDAYGWARHHDWRDVDGDGDYDTVDKAAIDYIVLNAFSPSGEPISSAAYYDPDADLDRNGIINGTDSTAAGTNWAAALARGVLSSDAVDNATGYDGYRYNPETMQYTVRNRWYDPVLGRWLQRDPVGYVDGMGLYQYVSGRPQGSVDPTGLVVVLIHGVNPDLRWYANAKTGLSNYWKKNPCPQEILEFRWFDKKGRLGGLPTLATSSVEAMQQRDRSYLWDAANRLASLIQLLDDVRTYEKSNEPVNIIAHSQGTIIALGALQRLMGLVKVDNVILMGSPLSQNHKDDIRKARRGIRGQLYNYWATGDNVANLAQLTKGGATFGGHGSDGTPGVVDRQFEPGFVIHGYSIPGNGNGGHSFYMSNAAFFENIHAKDIDNGGDRKLTNSASMPSLVQWAYVGDPND